MIDLRLEELLGLPEFLIANFRQDKYHMEFQLEVKEIPSVCSKCDIYMPTLIIQKTRSQEVRDLNILSKCVTLIVKRHYYRCGTCNSMFAEPLQCLEGKARMTTRLREHIALKARFTPFVTIENEYRISDTTIRKIFLEDVARLPSFAELATPAVLGIDEICLARGDYSRKEAWAVLANGDDNTVMELLQDRGKPSIVRLLQSLQSPKAVQVVTMDMWSGYRSAVHEVLPSAMVVIDKFHVVRMANEALDSVRRSITRTGSCNLKKNRAVFLMREDRLSEKGVATRNEWMDEYPNLKAAYELKESFFRMYDCSTRSDAERYYEEWQRNIPKELPGFRTICSTVRRSRREIFNYFDAPYTNAFVEGLNRAIRFIADQGCGYDFEVLRGKVLFTAGRKNTLYHQDG